MVRLRSFGAEDKLPCPRCRLEMRVTRRTIHPSRGEDYEYQELTCMACGHTENRTVDRAGNTIG